MYVYIYIFIYIYIYIYLTYTYINMRRVGFKNQKVIRNFLVLTEKLQITFKN